MSGPYVYRPQAAYQPTYGPGYRTPSPFIPPPNLTPHSPYGSPYHSPYHSPYSNPTALPGGPPSPYGRSTTLPGGSYSPYGRPATLPGGSPHTPHSPLPGAPNTPLRSLDSSYGSYLPWQGYERQRRPSYHGPNPYEPYLHTPPIGHHRARSFGEGSSPYRPAFDIQSHWSPGGQYPILGTHIHDFLNGELPRGDFIFDISSPIFNPLKRLGPGVISSLSDEELNQPATLPSITRLRIICDIIPQWPIDLELNPTLIPHGYEPPPITLGDVLSRIYEELHIRITQAEWAPLSLEEENSVSRAFTIRCKALGNSELVERNHGVKRVDFLLGKIWFKGLTRVDGMEVMKMHVDSS